MATPVQILEKAVCIPHGFNTVRKDKHPTILFPAVGK